MQQIPFKNVDIDIPIIQLVLSGSSNFYALIDSGSEVSIFSPEFCAEHKKELLFSDTIDMNITGLAGKASVNSICVKAECEFTADTGKKGSLFLTGFIYDMAAVNESLKDAGISVDAIIGSDFLSEAKAAIDYKKKVLKIR